MGAGNMLRQVSGLNKLPTWDLAWKVELGYVAFRNPCG
jgi:hypothetical protein